MLDPNPPTDPAVVADEARTKELFEASKTFLLRTPDPRVAGIRIITLGLMLLLFFVAIPLLAAKNMIPVYKVNLLGKYLCFGILALGIDLIWGYTGLLSLCQALFFALGGYAMAMHLSLPEGGGQYDYPQFMTFAYYGHGTDLPWFWVPFRHFWFALFAGIAVPGIVAGVFGFVILRSRVRGVYFSIVTQALAAAAWLLISRNEMLLGGTNGLTNFYKPMIQAKGWIIGLYLLTLTLLVLSYVFCQAIVRSRLGRVLVAIRDKETRLYFAGYKPYAFKVFAFSVGAMLAGIGGTLYPAQMGIITPQDMNVEASIFVVVMVALGGRGRLWGSVFGALMLIVLRSSLSSDFSGAWLLVEGLIAIVVVLFLPDGMSGLWQTMERQIAAGENLIRAALPTLPLVGVSIFVALEALGLMPSMLQGESFHPMGIAPKYWLLLAVLVAAGYINWSNKKEAERRAAVRGFATEPVDESHTEPSESTLVSPSAKGGM